MIIFAAELAVDQLLGFPFEVPRAAPSELRDGILEGELVRQLLDSQVSPQLIEAEFVFVGQKRFAINAAVAKFRFERRRIWQSLRRRRSPGPIWSAEFLHHAILVPEEWIARIIGRHVQE
jgi:hypothetical protein